MNLIGVLDEDAKNNPTDARKRWLLANPLFSRMGSRLLANANIKWKYIEETVKFALEEGLQYLETRQSVGKGLYVLDRDTKYNVTNGKRYMDNTGEIEIIESMKVIQKLKERHHDFIGRTLVAYGYRRVKSDIHFLNKLKKLVKFHKKYPNYIVGFDLVAEEDSGNSLMYFLHNFLKLYENASMSGKLPYYFHAGETNWPSDLHTSYNEYDPMTTNENTLDAILLGTHRVGHGLAYVKHPLLMEVLKYRKIAIELCPVSNQILGYVPDLRNHPGVTFLRYGIPVVLAADDPGTFGYNSFTLDWYEAYLGWGLTLSDLKQLAINSLEFSSLTGKHKTTAMKMWTQNWNRFINEMKEEACLQKFQQPPSFDRIIPKTGSRIGQTHVHIFGNNLEHAICKTIKCKFGKSETTAVYINQRELVCMAQGHADDLDKPVKLAVDLSGDYHFIETNQTFVFMENQQKAKENILPPSLRRKYKLKSWRNCHELKTNFNFKKDGVYEIVQEGRPLKVRCDMSTENRGWIVFQRRINGSQSFVKNWNDYKHGFGDLNGEFWMGNELLSKLTASSENVSYVLRIDLEDTEGNEAYAEYANFWVGSEEDKYRLHVGAFRGTAGNAFRKQGIKQSTMPFTTFDRTNFSCKPKHCYSGFWISSCKSSNVNVPTRCKSQYGMTWLPWKNHYLKKSEMKFIPVTAMKGTSYPTDVAIIIG